MAEARLDYSFTPAACSWLRLWLYLYTLVILTPRDPGRPNIAPTSRPTLCSMYVCMYVHTTYLSAALTPAPCRYLVITYERFASRTTQHSTVRGGRGSTAYTRTKARVTAGLSPSRPLCHNDETPSRYLIWRTYRDCSIMSECNRWMIMHGLIDPAVSNRSLYANKCFRTWSKQTKFL